MKLQKQFTFCSTLEHIICKDCFLLALFNFLHQKLLFYYGCFTHLLKQLYYYINIILYYIFGKILNLFGHIWTFRQSQESYLLFLNCILSSQDCILLSQDSILPSQSLIWIRRDSIANQGLHLANKGLHLVNQGLHLVNQGLHLANKRLQLANQGLQMAN